MEREQILAGVETRLKERRASVERVGETLLSVAKRNAIGKTVKKELNLEPLLLALSGVAEPGLAAGWIASFVEGVDREICMFKSKLVEAMGFHEAAARMVMRLEGPGFALGVEAAGGDTPFLKPWHAGLALSYWIEMDQFMLVLSAKKFASWGVTFDRLHSAARSILYDKTRYHETEAVSGASGVERYQVGDGYDASRALVLPDLDWHRCRAGVLIGIPNQSEMMVTDRKGADLASFAKTVQDAYAGASYPLTPELFTVKLSKVSPLEAWSGTQKW